MAGTKDLAVLRVSDMTTPEIVSHIGVLDNLIGSVEDRAEYINKHNELGGINDKDKKEVLDELTKKMEPLKSAYFSLKQEYGLRFKKRFNAPNPLNIAESLNGYMDKYPILKKSLQALYQERQELMMKQQMEAARNDKPATVKKMAKA